MKTQQNMMETLKINLSIAIGHTWFFFSALLWKPVRHDRLSTSVQRQSKNGDNGRGLPQKQFWALSPQKIEIRPHIWNALLLRRSFVIVICHILNIKTYWNYDHLRALRAPFGLKIYDRKNVWNCNN